MPLLSKEALEQRIIAADGPRQLHLLDGFDNLSPEQQGSLAAQVERIFVPGTVGPTTVFEDSVAMSAEPPTGITAPRAEADTLQLSPADQDRMEKAGLDFIAAGKAAVVVLAGGSGTRLGVSFPKGMLVCPDLVAKKSLFQLQCEKIRRVEVLAAARRQQPTEEENCEKVAVKIPLIYMTGPATDAPTRAFFAEHSYFGLDPSQVHFTCQSTMPCFTAEGQVVLSAPGVIAEAPGGNAGLYGALAPMLPMLRQAGVEYVQVANVDNLVVRLADPAFFGVAAAKAGQLQVVAKTITKVSDHEAVGVFARRSYPQGATAIDAAAAASPAGRWGVTEYTEIGKELAEKKDPTTGARVFDCANIGLYLYSLAFLERAAVAMQTFAYYHVARKPIPTSLASARFGAEDGATTVPGVKLEAFIFDLFLLLPPSVEDGAFTLLLVDRAEEFSAIKNADDPVAREKGAEPRRDSPQSAVRDLHQLHARWLRVAVQNLRQQQHTDEGTTTTSALAATIPLEKLPAAVELGPLFAALGPADVARRLVSSAANGKGTRLSQLAELVGTFGENEVWAVPDDAAF